MVSVLVDVFADIAAAHPELLIEIEERNLQPLCQKCTYRAFAGAAGDRRM
jgi:hypothetical protein